MKLIRSFTVVPSLPEPLQRLGELAYNLWWLWNADAEELFRRVDLDRWESVEHNPVRLLGEVPQDRLERLADDGAFLAHMERVLENFDLYMSQKTWYADQFGESTQGTIAYFSAEFGLHMSLPIYSGGLGVLAGDHLKSASDLGLPLVGVGLLYRQGYFHQYLTNDGWQFEDYPDTDFHHLPITPVRNEKGDALQISVEMQNHTMLARVWKIQVGRVPLYVLDSDIAENPPEFREITRRLYGGDKEMRIRQEMLLGIGGTRALSQMGIIPAVCHMNEGHSAFLALERVRQIMGQSSLSFDEAREAVAASTVFTTHTPVPAGIDSFNPAMVESYLAPLARALGLSKQKLLALGRHRADDAEEEFCMALLAFRLAASSNGVSQLHGDVSRKMFQPVWPGLPTDEVPIQAVTNGVHVRTWLSLEFAHLFDRYLGPRWANNPVDQAIWQRINEIPDAEVWRSRERLRERLVAATRTRLRRQLERGGAPPAAVRKADEALDPEALTIGFARRFAPYKRATLFMRNPDRLLRILSDPHRPVQFIVAGKAHPRDDLGKELIKHVVEFTKRSDVRGHIVFLEDYDLRLAEYLVQGVDVWLNTPKKLHEASGTSGMKVLPNGGINLSIRDGWWAEAYDGENGWAIGDDRHYDNDEYQDYVESECIYDLLEQEIIPKFYKRGRDGVPRQWVARMKASMRTLLPRFNTNRMVREYTEKMYRAALERWADLTRDECRVARDLAGWRSALRQHWGEIRVESVQAGGNCEFRVGSEVHVTADVHLGPVQPDSVEVQLYHGRVDAHDQLYEAHAVPMRCEGPAGDGRYRFIGAVPCVATGHCGYTVRILPHHPDLGSPFNAGLVRWG